MHQIAENVTEKESIERLIHRFGGSASEALLEAPCSFFCDPAIEGTIGYLIEGDCAVTFGDPICKEEDVPKLTDAFHRYCAEKNLNIIYFIVSERFTKWATPHFCSIAVEVGEELIFDPQNDPTDGAAGQKLRYKVNHVRQLGLQAHELVTQDEALRSEIQQVGQEWLKGRKGLQIHLGTLDFFKNPNDKRWFYVTYKGKVIAAALLSKLEAFQGWLLKFLVAHPMPREVHLSFS